MQSSTIDDTPINDLFYIRNIGNQIDSAKGSVRYGVQYLHTPVLLIIGHVDCGAVKAAIGDYKKKPIDLRKELYTFDFPDGISEKDGVIHNIHNQVDTALKMFIPEVKDNKLVVIGAIYDFKNKYKHGYNRLIIVNLNGETDPQIITKNHYLKGIKDLKIGV
ncbi:MAG: carbonic anhydrase [Rickettsiaceae bacterium]